MTEKQIDDQLVKKLKRLNQELHFCDINDRDKIGRIWSEVRACRWELQLHRADGKVVSWT